MIMAARWLFSLVAMGLLVAEVQGAPPALSNRPPDSAQKSPVHALQPRVLMRQGGDTMATATPIASMPFVGSGTTVGFANDYDTVCPHAGSDSPDVVYSFTRPQYGTLTIDLCGSDFDTKIYVMSAAGQIFDCNDDYYDGGICGLHTSRIDNLWLPPGETYYLVVDGAGGAAGHYEFEMRRWGADQPVNGDTIADAMIIPALPYNDTGTTAGFTDDYDEVCPYIGSTAPDVVYAYAATSTEAVDIDLCGSSYDTKLYVYDASLNLIACNDDFYPSEPCGVYVSKLENVTLNAGTTYYIIIDGYGSASGAYIIDIAGVAPCAITCPFGSYHEGEPDLVDDYVDNYNGGCNSPGSPFQYIDAGWSGVTFCGVSGWYTIGGGNSRDTDWFIATAGSSGAVEITADAEYATYIFELGPRDCASVGVIQNVIVGPCAEGYMTIPAAPMEPVWFWVGPTVFAPPVGGDSTYDYVLWLAGGMVVTESTTWSTMKALYR
jgi:hypothetical protein